MPKDSGREVTSSRGGPNAKTALWVLATPIGNLGDLSARAREVLAKADGVLCEDTRRTSNLVSALGLSKSLYRLDHHATERDCERYVERMRAGEVFVYASDAGTPGVSDPGARLVEAVYLAGLPVSPLPGPSAVTALLSVAGWEETAFSFQGFFPRKEKEREASLSAAAEMAKKGLGRVFFWFESPERLAEACESIEKNAPNCEAVFGKELTKLHEKIYKGRVRELGSHIQRELVEAGNVGEWIFALRFVSDDETASDTDDVIWEKTLQCCLNAGVSASRAAREVSQSFGVAKNLVYKRALELAESAPRE